MRSSCHAQSAFIEHLQRSFERHAERPAIRYRHDTLTYAELQRLVEGIGGYLHARGLQRGDRVALYTPEKFPFLTLHLGVILGGGISLPLNPRFTASEMEYFLRDSGATFVFASGEEATVIDSCRKESTCLTSVFDPMVVLQEVREHLDSWRLQFRDTPLAVNEACLMLYSSGTTGQPKGVVHTQGNLASSLLALQTCWAFTPEDVLLNVLPLFHIHGLSFATHLSLLSGACMILEDRFHPLHTMHRLREATVFMAVPTIYEAFLRRPEFPSEAQKWSRLRLLTCGSAPIRPEVIPKLEGILGHPLINRYGMTESHVITSLPLGGPFKRGSVGIPLEGIEMKLVTAEGDTGAPGAKPDRREPPVGEITVRGPNLFSHYWNKPEATAAAFDAEGFFATGDLGFLDADGFLTLVGRKKDLIITGGFNVYPPVVEQVLNAFPQVRESAVVGVPDPRKGERIVAFIVPEGTLDLQTLRKHCQSHLVDYQRPSRFELVQELPRNTMGKVLKRQLRELAQRDTPLTHRPTDP